MWFTPFAINYYYFGHLATAVLIRLSGVPANIAFNLMLSSIFAFCFTETFSLGANLYAFFKNNTVVQKNYYFYQDFLLRSSRLLQVIFTYCTHFSNHTSRTIRFLLAATLFSINVSEYILVPQRNAFYLPHNS